MALSVQRGTFTWNAADGIGVTYSATLSFTPVAVVAWCTGRAGTVDGAATGHMRQSIGFATGTASRKCIGAGMDDGASNAVAASIYREDAVLAVPTAAAVVEGLLDLDLFTTTLRFIVDDQGAQDVQVEWMALGGGDVTNVALDTFTGPAATGLQSYVVTGSFQPDVLLLLCTAFDAAPPGVTADACWNLGVATGAAAQWVVAGGANSGDVTTTTDGYARADEILALIGNGALAARAEFAAFLSTGFQLNWVSAFFNLRFLTLAIQGGRWAAGTLTTPTTLNGTAMGTTGWLPKAVLFASHARAQSAKGVLDAQAEGALGVACSPTDRAVLASLTEDAVATSDVYTGRQGDAVYYNLDATGADEGVIDLDAFLATGFRVIADDADSVAALLPYLAVAPTQDEPTSQPLPRRIHVHPVPLTAET